MYKLRQIKKRLKHKSMKLTKKAESRQYHICETELKMEKVTTKKLSKIEAIKKYQGYERMKISNDEEFICRNLNET
jgi:hypothetical protein